MCSSDLKVHYLSRGIIRTACLMYSLSRSFANILYWSVMAVTRMEMCEIEWMKNIDAALAIVPNVGELSLLPEYTLLVGEVACAKAIMVFNGSYVKF